MGQAVCKRNTKEFLNLYYTMWQSDTGSDTPGRWIWVVVVIHVLVVEGFFCKRIGCS